MEKILKSNQRITLTVAVLLLAAASNSAFASRLYLPMSDNIRQSELIVIGDTRKGDGAFDIIIRVSEVIKGDKELIGKDIKLHGRMLSFDDVWVEPDEKEIALLFQKDWGKSDKWPLAGAYGEPARVKALKTLIDVVSIEDDRKRILAMQKLFAGGDPDIQESTFSELRGMRNPGNFDLLTQWFDALDEKNQAELIKLMSQTMRDRRCVPTLIKALSSPALEVRSAAAHGLYFCFPGAPGIAEAFDAHLRTEGVTRSAARYLAMRFDNPEYAELAKPRDTRWLRAQQLEKEGQAAAARKLRFELISDKAESDYRRRSTAAKLVRDASPDELARIRKTLLPFLRVEVSVDNYNYVLETVRILRALHHPDCRPALIGVFQHQGSVYDAAMREATMAIHELGEEAKEEATQRLFHLLKSPPEPASSGKINGANSHLLALVWLADEEEFSKARKTMDPTYQRHWEHMSDMIGLRSAEDEGAFLIERLKAEKVALMGQLRIGSSTGWETSRIPGRYRRWPPYWSTSADPRR